MRSHSRPRSSARKALCALISALSICGADAATEEAQAGAAQRGRALVANRQVGMCLLCHTAPIPEERFQGDLAPSLAGVGARLSARELRARIADSRAINPASIMPAYFKSSGGNRVARAWQGRTMFTAEELDDVVAYLASLTEVPSQ